MNDELIFTGVKNLSIGDDDVVPLADGLALIKPNPFLLSARMRYAQNEHQYEEAEKVSRYLVYRSKRVLCISENQTIKDPDDMFFGGLMALQIVKPVSTLGFIFRGTDYGPPSIDAAIEARHPMCAAEWARMKRFDVSCLSETLSLIPRVQAAICGNSIPNKNAVTALQLGLENYAYHERIAGLLWVMGMEAIFDSSNRNDFRDKLCDVLGPDSSVFPDWCDLVTQPSWTVKDIAVDLYMLRNKIAHGVDLRSAMKDKTTPVDLLKVVRLHEHSDPRHYSALLSEAACYLLCRVIQKTI